MTVRDWLLDADPAVRWRALRDLADAPDGVVAAEERVRRAVRLVRDHCRWEEGNVLEGLLAHERAAGGSAAAVAARRGEEYLLDRTGTWPLENTHPGAVHFALEHGDGRPSRWNTLRALRVLRWYEGPAGPAPLSP